MIFAGQVHAPQRSGTLLTSPTMRAPAPVLAAACKADTLNALKDAVKRRRPSPE